MVQVGGGCEVKLPLEGNVAAMLLGPAKQVAADYATSLAAVGTEKLSPSWWMLDAALLTIERAQDQNSGGVPEVCESTAKPWYEHTTHEDRITSGLCVAMKDLWLFVKETGGKLGDQLGDRPLGIATRLIANGWATHDAIGFIPGKTLAHDPTTPAQGRPHIERYAADTDATVGWLNALVQYRAAVPTPSPATQAFGDALCAQLKGWVAQHETRPAYLFQGQRPVYRSLEGKRGWDKAKAIAGYKDGDWTAAKNQVRLWERGNA